MELLNGKAKELFEKWLLKERNEKIIDGKIEYDLFYIFKYLLPEICQNALIIEFLDSVGIYVEINYGQISQSWIYNIKLYSINNCTESFFASRQQATVEAIKKAVELINESNGK